MKSEIRSFLIVFGFTLFTFCAADRASYGDNCNRTIRCDSQASLSCVENRCECLKPTEMVYDENDKRCLILAGGKCSFTIVESLTDTFEEKRVTETFECVDNAVCDEYCMCIATYFEDTQGICRSKKLNGEHCTKDDECREDLQLKCGNGICSCDRKEAIFSGQCVAKVGVSCTKYVGCVPNAQCDRSVNLCTCNDGYENSTDGLCFGTYGMYCQADISPCINQFSCFDSKCDCHFRQHQSFDQSTGKCSSYAHGPCSEKISGSVLQFRCVENSKCQSHGGISECVCEPGYIVSYDRKCYPAHGQPCFTSDSCDKLPDLLCKNGQCSCKDFHVYDGKRTLCVGLVGAECWLSENSCHTGASCESNRFQIRDWSAINKQIRSSGTCRCLETHVPNSERECVPKVIIEEKEVIYEIAGKRLILGI